MKMWFLEYPEVAHILNDDVLRIFHPVQKDEFIDFELNERSVVLTHGKRKIEFKREAFKSLESQVLKIRSFWINEIFKEEDLDAKRPKISKNQFSVLLANRKYGQVFTTNGNLFTGWGEVYRVFCDLESAKKIWT